MNRCIFLFLLPVILLITPGQAWAQSANKDDGYKNALGTGIDFGRGSTIVGPSFKHFFSPRHVGILDVMFGAESVVFQAGYQYHQIITGAKGLQGYIGGSVGVNLGDIDPVFFLSPMTGLDYKLPASPLSFTIDWRPRLTWNDRDIDAEPVRFGLGIRFTW